MRNLNLVCIALVSTLLCPQQFCSAYEYHPTKKDEKIIPTDREIRFFGLDQIDIGLFSPEHHSHKKDSSKPIYFTRDQLRPFLLKEQHKDGLTAHISFMDFGEPYDAKKISPFLEGLGYSRIIIDEDSPILLSRPVLIDETLNDINSVRREQNLSTTASGDTSQNIKAPVGFDNFPHLDDPTVGQYCASARLQNNAGVAKLGRNDFDGAQRDFNSALKLEPDYVLALANRIIASHRLGDYNCALQDYERLGQLAAVLSTQMSPALMADDYAAQGMAREHRGDTTGALESYAKALEYEPNSQEVYSYRGALKTKMGDANGAQKDFAEVARIEKRFHDLGIYKYSIAHNEKDWDDWQKAVRAELISSLHYVKSTHPEFLRMPDQPHTVSFEVTRDRQIANIENLKTSGSFNFDSQVGFILFSRSGAKALTFPEGATDSFLRCKVSFYPNGNVSPVLFEHPFPQEQFDRRDIKIESKIPLKINYPPDLINRPKTPSE